jgi:flagellar hook-length control protein FliK
LIAAATVILPSVMPVEQVKPVNNLAPSNTIAEDDAPLSFIEPATENAKPSQMTKVSGDVLQGEAVFRQPEQSKQDVINLKYLGDAGQSEKTGRVEQQVLNLNTDGEKTVSRIGTDMIQPNRPVADNKTDVPAITKPLSHPEWNKDVGERIVWMSSKAIPSAEIRLNPQHLGPISVRVDVTDDKATVAFTAQHAVVRETLEASIPKLREMMSAQQINLVEVNVSQGSASDQGRSQAQNFAQTSGRGQGMVDGVIDGVDDVEQEIESGRAVVSKGLLSLYA